MISNKSNMSWYMHSHQHMCVRGTKGSRKFQLQEVTSAERFPRCWLNNKKETEWNALSYATSLNFNTTLTARAVYMGSLFISLPCEFLCLLASEVIWKTRLSRIPEDFGSTKDPMTLVLVFKRKHVSFYEEQKKYEWFGEPGVSGLCGRISDGRIQCFYSGSVGCSGFQHFNV